MFGIFRSKKPAPDAVTNQQSRSSRLSAFVLLPDTRALTAADWAQTFAKQNNADPKLVKHIKTFPIGTQKEPLCIDLIGAPFRDELLDLPGGHQLFWLPGTKEAISNHRAYLDCSVEFESTKDAHIHLTDAVCTCIAAAEAAGRPAAGVHWVNSGATFDAARFALMAKALPDNHAFLWSDVWAAPGSVDGPGQKRSLLYTSGVERWGALESEMPVLDDEMKDGTFFLYGCAGRSMVAQQPYSAGERVELPIGNGNETRPFVSSQSPSLRDQHKNIMLFSPPRINSADKSRAIIEEALHGKQNSARMFAIVMLKEKTIPAAKTIDEAVRKRFSTATSSNDSGQGEGGAILYKFDGCLGIVVPIDVPNPLSPEDSCVKGSWWWPQSMGVLKDRQSHIVVSINGGDEYPIDQAITLAKLVASIAEATQAIGVLWSSADALWKPDVPIKEVDRAGDKFPVPVLASVKLGRDSQFPRRDGTEAWLAMSYGLRAFGLMEVEIRGFDGEMLDAVALVMEVAGYLLDRGPVIKDGDTFGPTEAPKYQIRHEASTVATGTSVYRIYPGHLH